jgi:hypothetical protein
MGIRSIGAIVALIVVVAAFATLGARLLTGPATAHPRGRTPVALDQERLGLRAMPTSSQGAIEHLAGLKLRTMSSLNGPGVSTTSP